MALKIPKTTLDTGLHGLSETEQAQRQALYLKVVQDGEWHHFGEFVTLRAVHKIGFHQCARMSDGLKRKLTNLDARIDYGRTKIVQAELNALVQGHLLQHRKGGPDEYDRYRLCESRRGDANAFMKLHIDEEDPLPKVSVEEDPLPTVSVEEKPLTTVSEELRQNIRCSKKTTYRIAKDAGVSWKVLKEFVAGTRDVRASTIDALARYFGLRLV